jgi:hypothetical protein
MALTNPRVLFGVHSVTPYNRTTGDYYGELRVLGGSVLSISGELIKLNGGSQLYPWAIEEGATTAALALKVKEYPDFLFELFLGLAPTAAGAAASGTVDGFVNVSGTSIFDATTGIATVTATTVGDLKFGKYLIKYVSATTVDVYHSSDVDIKAGTDGEMQNDLLKITASALTVTTGAPVAVPNYGISLTGGSGTINFSATDTAEVWVLPASTKDMSVVVGATGDIKPEFGCLVVGQKRSNNEMYMIDLYRCRGTGLPLGAEEKAFSEAEIAVEAFYDSVKDGVFRMRHVTPS